MAMSYEQIKAKVEKYGQEQVLKYVDELTDAEKAVLFAQIEATDMDVIECCKHKEDLVKRGVILVTEFLMVWIHCGE